MSALDISLLLFCERKSKNLFIIESRCYNKHYFNIRVKNTGGFELYERKQKYS